MGLEATIERSIDFHMKMSKCNDLLIDDLLQCERRVPDTSGKVLSIHSILPLLSIIADLLNLSLLCYARRLHTWGFSICIIRSMCTYIGM
jgi:hypothetical protein